MSNGNLKTISGKISKHKVPCHICVEENENADGLNRFDAAGIPTPMSRPKPFSSFKS